MNPNIKIVGINPRSNGSELKYLSDVVTNIITTIKLVENKKVMDSKDYMKSHRQVADTTALLCKTVGIDISNRIITMDYLFFDVFCSELLK